MTTEIENFEIGDKVKHPKFGTGTIVFRTGEDDKQKVTVKFGGEVGEKKLLVSLAKLKLISERPTLAAAEEAPVEAVPGRAKLGKQDDDEEDDDDKAEVEDDDEDAEESDDDDDDDASDDDEE